MLGLAGAAGCMRYDGEIYRNFTYQEALHIDKNAWKALKMTCGGRQKRCPEFRFCRDKYDLARQHFVRGHGFAQFGFELGPHCIRGCDADLLADDRPQQRAVAGGANAFFGIAAALQRPGHNGVGCSDRIEVRAQLCVGQPHGECACLPRRD